jgi:hypothetical protein
MYKVDDIKKLRSELNNVPTDVDVVYAVSPEQRFSVECYVGIPTIFYLFVNLFRGKFRLLRRIKKSIIPKIEIVSDFYAGSGIVKKIVRLVLIRPVKNSHEFLLISSFGIFSGSFIQDDESLLYDETYINDNEDIDLSYRINSGKANTYQIKYDIGDLESGSFGKEENRFLRGIAGKAYFYEKTKNNF